MKEYKSSDKNGYSDMNKIHTKEKPIKVLAVVYRMMRGGTESRLMDIIRNIDHDKVSIDIFTYSYEPGVFDDEVRKLGGTVYYNKPLTIYNMLTYSRYFASFLRSHPEYRIVHAHQDAWCTVFCKGAQIAGVPVRIAHSRTAATTFTIKNMVRNIVKLPVKKYATHLLAVSDNAAKWLYGNKAYQLGKVTIMPNAIESIKYQYNTEIREAKRAELGLNGAFVVMHVGSILPVKNHEFLLNVFYQLQKMINDTKLVCVGGGSYSLLEKKARKLKIDDDVVFLGSRNDVPELLQAADVFVFPSKFEGLPGAVLEAQAAGLPCVISDVISKDVCVVDPLITMLSLKNSPKEWADTIVNVSGRERGSTLDKFISKKFDISALCGELTRLYK